MVIYLLILLREVKYIEESLLEVYSAVILKGGPHEHWDWPTPSHYSQATLRQEVGSWPKPAYREQPYLMPYALSHGTIVLYL